VRTLLQDIVYGLRQLRKAPGFTAVAILTLALGIGANTAIFTLVHAIMLQPLPVKDPGSLYRLGTTDVDCCMTGGMEGDWNLYSYTLYQVMERQLPEFEQLAALQAGITRLSVRRPTESGPPRAGRAEFVSGNYFPMFGLQAAAGRLLSPSDDEPNAAPAAVMSYRTWENYFASDPAIVGSTVTLNGTGFTVVGIAPPSFHGDRLTDAPPDFWLPLATEPLVAGATSVLKGPNMHWLYLIGRLKPGASPATVQARAVVTLQQWLSSAEGNSTVDESPRSTIAKQRMFLLPAAGGVNSLERESKKPLQLLSATAGLVLLIACANIANLLLARGAARKSQIAVRLALGARRLRLVRQLLTESVLLSALGGLAGLGIAVLVTRSILALAFRGSEYIPISPDPSAPVLPFSFLLSLVAGLVFGVAPAWISSNSDPAEALRSGDRTAVHGASFSQKLLVICQAAISLMLVAGAILLAQSLRNLEHQRFGFETDYRYMVQLGQSFNDFPFEKLPGTYRELQSRLSAIPGVITASYSLYSPMGGDNWSRPVYIDGRTPDMRDGGDFSSWLRVGPNYFETIGTHLRRGRTIGEQDTPTSTHVAVVNERFVKKFFPGEDPIGKHFGTHDSNHRSDWEIVGVVEDAKYQDTHGPAYVTYFLPYFQSRPSEGKESQAMRVASNWVRALELHVSGNPENLERTVRNILAEFDPDATVLRMTSFDEQVSEQLNLERLMSRLTLLFGCLALMLATVGLYGVTAYTVERRTREIGVRVAVGANRANVIAMVLRGAFRQVAVGLAIGIVLALVAGRLMASQLFEVKGYDPIAIAAAALLMGLFALIAGFIPACRAASIDPVTALRVE